MAIRVQEITGRREGSVVEFLIFRDGVPNVGSMNLTEVEIRSIPALDATDSTLLNNHSLLNLLTVLYGELSLVGLALADDTEFLQGVLDRCAEIERDLRDADATLRHAARAEDLLGEIADSLSLALDTVPGSRERTDVQESVTNIRSVLEVFRVRAREILSRAEAPEAWVEFEIDQLVADFRQVFAAIELNSHGRFHITFNPNHRGPKDYYVNFQVEGARPGHVRVPLIIKDVIRDLMANARKYTKPGGSISALLTETAEGLAFSVEDTGCGIPPNEIERVVHFGVRGSNVSQVRTLGGGFGLTKAFLVTQQFRGRFWIASELGVGTRVRLDVPKPVAHLTEASYSPSAVGFERLALA